MSFECDVVRATACFRRRPDHLMDLLGSVTTRVLVPFVAADEEIGMVDVAGAVLVLLWMTGTPSAVEAVRETGGGIASVTGTGIVIANASWIFVTASVTGKGSGTENESVTGIARGIATLSSTVEIASGIVILWIVEQIGSTAVTNRIIDASSVTTETDPPIIGNETAPQVARRLLDHRPHRPQVLFLRITPHPVFLVFRLHLWTAPCSIVLPIVCQTGHQISSRQQNQPADHHLSQRLVGILLLIDRSLSHPAPNHLRMLPLRR